LFLTKIYFKQTLFPKKGSYLQKNSFYKMSNSIHHPFFLEFSDFTFDNFWKEIFISCAQDRFPRGSRYDQESHTLYIRTPDVGGRNKTEQIKLPDKASDAYLLVTRMFQVKLNIYSAHDLRIKRQEMEETKASRAVELDCEWKKLKPKSLRDTFIMDYIIEIGNKYSLSNREVKKLFHNIQSGFQFKNIDGNDIEYNNGKVTNIRGVKYDPDEKKIIFSRSSQKAAKNEKNKTNKKIFQSIDRLIRENTSSQLKLE